MYNNRLGILENVKNLFKKINKIESIILDEAINRDVNELEIISNTVECVIDNYNAITGEE